MLICGHCGGLVKSLCSESDKSDLSDLSDVEVVENISATNARAKFSPDCCDESKQDLRDWIECGFKFCPWCGRELRPMRTCAPSHEFMTDGGPCIHCGLTWIEIQGMKR